MPVLRMDSVHGERSLVLGQLLNRVNMGGAENYVVLVANMHGDAGGDSQVIVLTEPGPLSGRFNKNVTVNYLGYFRQSIRNPFKFVFSLINGYRLLSKAIKSQGIEVLQTHLPDANLWGMAMALTGQCKIVITVHSNRFLEFDEGTSFGSFVKYYAYKLMVKKCAAVVAVSDEVRNSLLEKLKVSDKDASKVVAVNNGVLVPELFTQLQREQTRRENFIEPEEVWLVAVGRFNKVKNFQSLVRVAANLRDRGCKFRLLIAGDGELRKDLEDLCSELNLGEYISMPGNLNCIPDILRSADILMMPSLWEGLPLVLLEGMACGLAAVGSRTKGIADIMVDQENGLLAEVDDVGGFADAVVFLEKNPEIRRQMGIKGRSLVIEKYSLERTYRDLCVVYSNALSVRG